MNTENKEFELRECPFCGKSEGCVKQPLQFSFPLFWMVECGNCFCSTPLFDTKQKAVDFWNTRYNDNE
jgi:hypothetical protein